MEDTNLLTQSLKSHEIYLKIVDDSLQNLEDFSERLQLRLKCDDVDNHCIVEFCQGNYHFVIHIFILQTHICIVYKIYVYAVAI